MNNSEKNKDILENILNTDNSPTFTPLYYQEGITILNEYSSNIPRGISEGIRNINDTDFKKSPIEIEENDKSIKEIFPKTERITLKHDSDGNVFFVTHVNNKEYLITLISKKEHFGSLVEKFMNLINSKALNLFTGEKTITINYNDMTHIDGGTISKKRKKAIYETVKTLSEIHIEVKIENRYYRGNFLSFAETGVLVLLQIF